MRSGPLQKTIVPAVAPQGRNIALKWCQPSASSCAQVPQDSANLAPTWSQNGTKHLQNRAQMAPRGTQNGVPHRPVAPKTAKKSEKNANASKKRAQFHSGAPLEPKKWPTWSQLGSQNGAKMAKKSIPKSIIFLMPLGIDFWMDFGGFWVPKWSQVGTKMGSKIDVSENMQKRVWS